MRRVLVESTARAVVFNPHIFPSAFFFPLLLLLLFPNPHPKEEDAKQDWTLISATTTGDLTTLVVKRATDTGDLGKYDPRESFNSYFWLENSAMFRGAREKKGGGGRGEGVKSCQISQVFARKG